MPGRLHGPDGGRRMPGCRHVPDDRRRPRHAVCTGKLRPRTAHLPHGRRKAVRRMDQGRSGEDTRPRGNERHGPPDRKRAVAGLPYPERRDRVPGQIGRLHRRRGSPRHEAPLRRAGFRRSKRRCVRRRRPARDGGGDRGIRPEEPPAVRHPFRVLRRRRGACAVHGPRRTHGQPGLREHAPYRRRTETLPGHGPAGHDRGQGPAHRTRRELHAPACGPRTEVGEGARP